MASRFFEKVTRLAYTSSPQDLVQWSKARLGGTARHSTKKYVPPTTEFLRSRAYEIHMSRHLPLDGSFDLHEAQNETLNFRYRHHEVAHQLGVFRWRGMQKHLATVLPLVTDARSVVADLGGAAGPLGFDSHVVDLLPEDIGGRPIRYHSISDFPQRPSVIFTSHMLEHVGALDTLLDEVVRNLTPGGHFLVHLPSFYCERWRAGAHSSARYQDHVWTFGIGPAPRDLSLSAYVDIEEKLSKLLTLKTVDYCGDDSIFIHAVKP